MTAAMAIRAFVPRSRNHRHARHPRRAALVRRAEYRELHHRSARHAAERRRHRLSQVESYRQRLAVHRHCARAPERAACAVRRRRGPGAPQCRARALRGSCAGFRAVLSRRPVRAVHRGEDGLPDIRRHRSVALTWLIILKTARTLPLTRHERPCLSAIATDLRPRLRGRMGQGGSSTSAARRHRSRAVVRLDHAIPRRFGDTSPSPAPGRHRVCPAVTGSPALQARSLVSQYSASLRLPALGFEFGCFRFAYATPRSHQTLEPDTSPPAEGVIQPRCGVSRESAPRRDA